MQGTVPANGDRTVTVPAKVTYMELLRRDAPGCTPRARCCRTWRNWAVGECAVAEDLRLPMKRDGQLPIPTVPDVEVTEIKWDKVGLDQAAGVVRLKATNKNDFPVNLSKIDYALALGGTEVAKSSLAKAVPMAKGGIGAVDIPISISPAQAGMGLFRMLSGGGSSYSLKGGMDAGTPYGPLALPLSKAGDTVFKR